MKVLIFLVLVAMVYAIPDGKDAAKDKREGRYVIYSHGLYDTLRSSYVIVGTPAYSEYLTYTPSAYRHYTPGDYLKYPEYYYV